VAISVAELRDKPRPVDDWIIEGLLTRGNTAFVMGPPKKACKSWLLLDAMWSLSEGQPMWQVEGLKPPKQMRTVYFTQEDTERNIQDRVLLHLNVGHREATDRLRIVPKDLNMVLDTPEGFAQIKRELHSVVEKAGAIDLVVFDPMRKMHVGEENDSQTIGRLWARLDAIHQLFGCATIIAHHVKKPPHDRANYDPTDPFQGRGSGDIYGGGDAFVMVVPGPLASDGKSWRRVDAHFESKRGEQIAPVRLEVSFVSGGVKLIGNVTPAI